jgi:general secretion pathway protein G
MKNMREKIIRGFSLVELIIIVAILGIMAAIIVPQFQMKSTEAKGAVAKDSLRILRSAIELYTAQHGGIPPGYKDDDLQETPTYEAFNGQLVVGAGGNYLKKMPKNPFNELQNVSMVGNSETFPANPVAGCGWVYQPATKTIRLSWPGSDADGIAYYNY